MASSRADEVTYNEPESSPRSLQPAVDRDNAMEDGETSPYMSSVRPKRRNRKRNASKNLACSGRQADTSEVGSSLEAAECQSGPLIQNRGWAFFPLDIQDLIFTKLEIKDLFRAKAVSKLFNDHINSDGFHGYRGEMHPQEGSLTALHFSVLKYGLWQCAGYDLISKSWKKLPPFQMLPCLDPKLFKDHSICGAGGIMCANVSTSSSTHEKMIVFNPLTGRWKELPPLNHPRNPVLMHMVVDSAWESYKIIVAGSARASHEHLSKITEVFDSRTQIWTVTQDLPGPLFALNEHQTGIYRNGVLYCIAFLEGEDSGKGILAFSVKEGKWLQHLSCPLPNPTNLNIVQLVASNEEIFLFSEIEHNPYIRNVEHRIDILDDVVLTTSGQARGKWRNVISETKVGSQAGLQVYPEYACVPFGEGKVCIFNTIVHTGFVFDIQSGNRNIETLPSPTWSSSGEMGFYSMNPLTFSFEPSFKGNPKL